MWCCFVRKHCLVCTQQVWAILSLHMFLVGGLLGPRAVRVSGMAETECASGKPSV